MKRGTTLKPKFARLKRSLGIPMYQATGILEALWYFTAENAEDGDLSRFDAQDIADFMEWTGDPAALIDALVDARWLDRRGKRLSVHDWEDHLPKSLHDRARKRKWRNDLQATTEPEASTVSRDCPGTSRDIDAPVLSSPVLSSPVLSSPPLGRERDSRNERVTETDTGAVPSALREAQEIRVSALGEAARLADDEQRRLRGYVAECAKRMALPAFLVQWRGFHADAYALGQGCPVDLFVKSPSKYAPKPVATFTRPVVDTSGSLVVE